MKHDKANEESMGEHITHEYRVIAVQPLSLYMTNIMREGIQLISPEGLLLQLGYMNRPKG
jgi:hypothetical protein